MSTIPYQQVKAAGTALTLTAASGGGDKVAPNEHGCFVVRNGSGGSMTVTLAVPGNTRYGQAQPDVAVAVAAGATEFIGPLPVDLADVDGLVAFTYSSPTSVTVGAVTI